MLTEISNDDLIPERELSFRRQEVAYLRGRLAALERTAAEPSEASEVEVAQRHHQELADCLAETCHELQQLRLSWEQVTATLRESEAQREELQKLRSVLETELAAWQNRCHYRELEVEQLKAEGQANKRTIERLAGAEHELTRLLNRMSRTPLVVLFRRWPGYRRLEQEWADQ